MDSREASSELEAKDMSAMISAPDRDPFAFSCKDSLSHRNKANGCSVVKKPCNAIIQRCYSGMQLSGAT